MNESGPGCFLPIRGRVCDSKEDIESLNQRALGIAAATQLHPAPRTFSIITGIVINTTRQPSMCHILATGEERPELVVEDSRIIVGVHFPQDDSEVVQAIGERVQQGCEKLCVVGSNSFHGVSHQ